MRNACSIRLESNCTRQSASYRLGAGGTKGGTRPTSSIMDREGERRPSALGRDVFNYQARGHEGAILPHGKRPDSLTALQSHRVDSGARCNGFMKTEFGRLCQAL